MTNECRNILFSTTYLFMFRKSVIRNRNTSQDSNKGFKRAQIVFRNLWQILYWAFLKGQTIQLATLLPLPTTLFEFLLMLSLPECPVPLFSFVERATDDHHIIRILYKENYSCCARLRRHEFQFIHIPL